MNFDETKITRCPHCHHQLEIVVDVTASAEISMFAREGLDNGGKGLGRTGEDALEPYKPSLPDTGWFGAFRPCSRCKDGERIGWTDGKVMLVIEELPSAFRLDEQFQDRLTNAQTLLTRPQGSQMVKPTAGNDVKVALVSANSDQDKLLAFIWRPALDLANYLWPFADIWTNPADDKSYIYFTYDGEIKMLTMRWWDSRG